MIKNASLNKIKSKILDLHSGLKVARPKSAYIDKILVSFKKEHQRLLVMESNGFGLTALVVYRDADQLVVEGSAISKSTTPLIAVSEVLELLQKEVSIPFKEAILVSANVIPALLDLPIENDSKIENRKMLELVRWEMEGLFSEQISQWNIGWLLLGKGYLTEQQRDEILQDMEADAKLSASRGGRAPARFGEEAIKRSYVKREQLEECLGIQENLYLLDESIDCNWQIKPTSAGNQKGLWLSAAIGAMLRDEWVDAFRENDIRLQKVYPLAGTAIAGLCSPTIVGAKAPTDNDPQDTASPSQSTMTTGPQLLLEIQLGYIACSRIENQQVTQFAMQKCCDHPVTEQEIAELCQSLLSVEINYIWLNGKHPRLTALSESLTNILNRPLWLITQRQQWQLKKIANEEIPRDGHSEWNSLLGAAQHYLGLAPKTCAISLQGQKPPPPLYKQPKVQLASAVSLVIMAIVVSEAYLAWKTHSMQQEIDKNQDKVSKVQRINETINSKSAEYKKVKDHFDELNIQHLRLKKRKHIIESVLIKRQQFAEALLPMLARNIPDQIIIHSITEDDWYNFVIEGWSMNQSAIDNFNTRLVNVAERWGLYISDSPSEVQLGRNDLEGYAFTFTIKPKESL